MRPLDVEWGIMCQDAFSSGVQNFWLEEFLFLSNYTLHGTLMGCIAVSSPPTLPTLVHQVILKDRWTTLRKAAERGFLGCRDQSMTVEVQQLTTKVWRGIETLNRPSGLGDKK